MFVPTPAPSLRAQQRAGDLYEASASEMFMQGLRLGFEDTTTQLAQSLAETSFARDGKHLSSDEWQKSPHFRPGIKYENGMTEELAELMAIRHDKRQMEAFLSDKSTGLGKLAELAGAFIGSIPDPLNFIPFLGWAGKFGKLGALGAKIVKRTGPIRGRAFRGAADASIGVGLLQPAIALERSELQDPWDVSMAFLNISMAAGVGAGFGALAGVLAKKSARTRIAAMSTAIAQKLDDKAVDVRAVLGDLGPDFSKADTIAEMLRTRGEISEGTALRSALNTLAQEVDVRVQARAMFDFLVRGKGTEQGLPEGVFVNPAGFDSVRGIRITDEMREIAAAYREVRGKLKRVESPDVEPAIRELAAVKAERLQDEAEQRMAVAILGERADTAKAGEGMPVDAAVAEVRKTADGLEKEFTTRAEELKKQVDDGLITRREEVAVNIEMDRLAIENLKKIGQITAREASEQMRALDDFAEWHKVDEQARFFREVGEETTGTQADMTVFHTDDPDLPAGDNITAKTIFEPDDSEIPMLDSRLADLEDSDLMPEAAAGILETAETTAVQQEKLASAVKRGAACLVR